MSLEKLRGLLFRCSDENLKTGLSEQVVPLTEYLCSDVSKTNLIDVALSSFGKENIR